MDSDRCIPFTPYPLAWLAAALAAGIMTGQRISLSLSLLACCAVLSFSLTIWSLCRGYEIAGSVLVIVIATLAGATLVSVEKSSVPADQIKQLFEAGTITPGDPVELTGVMDGPAETAPESLFLQLRVERIRIRNVEHSATGVVELLAPVRDQTTRAEFDALELRYGARLVVMTQLERTNNYRNPGVSTFTEYLDRKGYDATGVIKSPLLVERLDDRRVFLPLAWLYRWHERLEAQIKASFSVDAAGVLEAALLGNRRYLSHATAERFRQGGTFHILVINGLHISFIGLVVLLIVRRFTRKRSWQFVVPAIVLWSYALAVGAQSAVVRASLMFTFVALAPLLARRATSLNALGGAALVLLLWRPGELFDPSFQLTFLSVLAIVVIAAPLVLKLSLIGGWRPTRNTPYPPSCGRCLRGTCEVVFLSERGWQADMALKSQLSTVQVHHCRSPGALSPAALLAIRIGRRNDLCQCPAGLAADSDHLLSSGFTGSTLLECLRLRVDGTTGNGGAGGPADFESQSGRRNAANCPGQRNQLVAGACCRSLLAFWRSLVSFAGILRLVSGGLCHLLSAAGGLDSCSGALASAQYWQNPLRVK
jgi:competence protein ComEC